MESGKSKMIDGLAALHGFRDHCRRCIFARASLLPLPLPIGSFSRMPQGGREPMESD
jgi:hypothetical protein